MSDVTIETQTRPGESEQSSVDLADWAEGRAGMLYRDLTPADIRSQALVSHIRLPFDGEVPDYVHYHKVVFQAIYCVKGRIKVVYEDQGGPFWLEPGDCVLQPPEIRHRVLECEANSEVIEVVVPAEHETFADNEMKLPTGEANFARKFGKQPFIRLRAAEIGPETANFAKILASITEKIRLDESIIQLIHQITKTIQPQIEPDGPRIG